MAILTLPRVVHLPPEPVFANPFCGGSTPLCIARIVPSPISMVLVMDASLLGWGQFFSTTQPGGQWSPLGVLLPNNILELRAIFLFSITGRRLYRGT